MYIQMFSFLPDIRISAYLLQALIFYPCKYIWPFKLDWLEKGLWDPCGLKGLGKGLMGGKTFLVREETAKNTMDSVCFLQLMSHPVTAILSFSMLLMSLSCASTFVYTAICLHLFLLLCLFYLLVGAKVRGLQLVIQDVIYNGQHIWVMWSNLLAHWSYEVSIQLCVGTLSYPVNIKLCSKHPPVTSIYLSLKGLVSSLCSTTIQQDWLHCCQQHSYFYVWNESSLDLKTFT